MSIKSIKEKELLVNFARAMGQAVDPKLAEEVDRINAIRNSVRASVSENIFKDLGAAVTSAKYEPDDGPLTEVQLEQIKETVVPEIQFPVPPSLDELLLVLNEQIEEVKNELVQTQPEEESPETETPIPNTANPEPVAEQSISDRTSEFLSKSKDSFQQPDPLKVAPDIDAITKKLRFLEQWISKVSMAGPGGGEVKLRFLDDVDRSTIGDGKYLNFNESTGKFQFSTLSSGGSEADTLHTVTSRGNVTTNPVTVLSANANYFGVNTNANYTVTTGQIAWNAADLTFDMGMANGVTLQVGQEQYIKVKAGSAISDGQAVMFGGADGEHIIAVPNDASVPGYIPEWFIGIATQDLALNAFGYITTFGKVNKLNTLAWNVGDILYADPLNVGGLVNVEPLAPYPNIVVAAVTKRAGGDGHLMVRPTWRSDIHQLNDVNITSATNGQILLFQNNVWINSRLTTANVSESNSNLYYTNARVYANVISLLNAKANVIDLATANVRETSGNLYFTNARAVSAITNTSLSNVTISYAPATTAGYGIVVNAANTQGGVGYSDFLKVTNTSGGATNPNKSFRLNSAGGIEIINSAYTSTIFSLSDSGSLNTGQYQVNGKQAVNGPAFSAYPTSPAQTIATASSVRVNFGNEEYDVGSCYDAPNGKFQPNVEGYYQLNATVRIDGSSGTGERMIVIYKNGAEYKRGTNESGTETGANFFSMSVSCQAYANGSTDNFQVYVVQNSGFNRTVSEFQQISYFQGCMLRGA